MNENPDQNFIPPSDVIKAIWCNIPLGESTLDAYMLPSGEKRIGVENIGAALGYSKDFFFKRTKRESKSIKALQSNGFSGEQLWLNIIGQDDGTKESLLAKTISVRDFVKLTTYEATAEKNLKAIILLAAFAETGLERLIEDAFAGRDIEFILEKIVHFSKWTNEELEEVLQYNREELKALYSWHGRELFGRKNPNMGI